VAALFLICTVAVSLIAAGVKYRSSIFVHGEAVASSLSSLSSDVKLATPSVPLPAALMYTGTVAHAQEESSTDTAHGLLPPASVGGTNTAAGTADSKPAPKKRTTTSISVVSDDSTDSSTVSTGYYHMPTTGKNWGILHAHNGVDIANACGTPVKAAAAGTVTSIGSGWNGGYGNDVIIHHPNGTETLYAHLQKIEVSEGDSVDTGDLLGLMGETGEATGCHLHFEVHGAKNPFAFK
jgi:murein DD-endopeptidase MepM/ murein hydrolase activator NlpD